MRFKLTVDLYMFRKYEPQHIRKVVINLEERKTTITRVRSSHATTKQQQKAKSNRATTKQQGKAKSSIAQRKQAKAKSSHATTKQQQKAKSNHATRNRPSRTSNLANNDVAATISN